MRRLQLHPVSDSRNCPPPGPQVKGEFHMRKSSVTKALYAGSFDPITRGHLDIIGKALMTFDAVHVAIGTNVRKQRAFDVEASLRLIERSVVELWPEAVAGASELSSGDLLFEGALEVGEYTN